MRPGLDLLEELPGDGNPVQRHHFYRIRLRMWLNRGDPVRWDEPWGLTTHAQLTDDGATLTTDVRLDREYLINGLFYGCLGMSVGGTRTVQIAPHLAYGEAGVPGVIPANALLKAQITVIEELTDHAS